MPSKATVVAITGAVCSSLMVVGAAAFALDHNDGDSAYQGIVATKSEMRSPSKTILGQDFTYPAGVPLMESFSIEIPVGKRTSLHKHAIPMFVYMTSGELEVDYGSKGTRTFKPGESYVEAIDWCHFGRAVGNEPAKFIGIYLGQQKPDQITPEICTKAE